MEIISNPTLDEIKGAARALKNGHLVAFPTETVYGLGADATNENAVSQVYAVKGRPSDHPLIVHISSINQMSKWAIDIPDYAIKLARDFWPGPMTLILKRSDLAKDFITGGQENVGLRVPNQPLAFALLTEFESLGGQGVAAPSANRFGAVSPTTADAVVEELGYYLDSADLVLNGGQCLVGIESTIIDCTNDLPRILRPGAITNTMMCKLLKLPIELDNHPGKTRSSGMMKSHYSPKAKILINGPTVLGDGFIAINEVPTPADTIRLMSPLNSSQFARELYMAMRTADNLGLKRIVVIPPLGDGINEAIRDRLMKSSYNFNNEH